MYVTQAKALIDAGTCNRVTSNGVCGSAATGYYKEFEYNGMMVVVCFVNLLGNFTKG